jgi:uncharacterized protein
VKVLVSGASGLIGSALVPRLEARGDEVARLVRSASSPAERSVRWDPLTGDVDAAGLAGTEAAVHLAGENVAGRWTQGKKERILASRERGTATLSAALAALEHRPSVLVCASAVGLYGDRGGEELTEESAAGSGFLPEVVRRWEAAAAPAREAGIRVVHLRFGVVMSGSGGMLGSLLTPFRLGLGGPVGSGRQYLSWVSSDDVVGAILHALDSPSLAGPVNVVAPSPVTSREFARTLGHVLGRPALLPVPAPALRVAFGREFANETLLGGARVLPRRLEQDGFVFRHPQLESALRAALAD